MFVIRSENDISKELLSESILFNYESNMYILNNCVTVRELKIIQKIFNASFKQSGNDFFFVMEVIEQ